jgi:hypothetical protein
MPRSGPWPAGLIVAIFVVLAALSPTVEGVEEPSIRWDIRAGAAHTFRIEYENSRQVEILDHGGRPLRRPHNVERRLAVNLRLAWTRVDPEAAFGSLDLARIDAARIEGPAALAFSGRPEAAIKLSVPLRLRRAAEPEVTLEWDARASRTLGRYCQEDAAVARELAALLAEALTEVFRFLPPAAKAGAPEAKWQFARAFRLGDGLELMARYELEHLPRQDPERPLARIEGSIGQDVVGAPERVARQPGLFPGTVRWLHDSAARFPHLLEAEKLTRLALPKRAFPILETITHRYRLRAGDPEAFTDPRAGR